MLKAIEVFRMAIAAPGRSWALFQHGTCVVLPSLRPEEDLAQSAKDLLAKEGPVIPGTPAGDFNPMKLRDGLGWIVTYPHAELLSYVEAAAVPECEDARLRAGLIGRSNRERDTEDLVVIHGEDRRCEEQR